MQRLVPVLAVLLFAISAKAQTVVNLPTSRCTTTSNPAPQSNYLSCYDIPVNANGILSVSVFAVISADGTVGTSNGFISNVNFQFNDSTSTGPEPMTGTFSGSPLYPNSGSLNASFTGQINGSISFTTVWKKPSPCYRYCNASLYQENGVLTLE
jgi:hypothetical protein